MLIYVRACIYLREVSNMTNFIQVCACYRCMSVHRVDYLACPHCGAQANKRKEAARASSSHFFNVSEFIVAGQNLLDV